MRVVEGPWDIKGRGFAVVLTLATGERAVVGDRLQREDGATWVLSGVDVGLDVPIGACILRGERAPSVGDELLLAIDVERRAWARLVRAAIDERDATFADEQCQPGAVEWLTRTRAEYEAALDGLRALGVDVNRLLEAT